jgi:predicted dehydrogenase
MDMYNWLFGLPEKVHGFANLGKYHDIEVEDEVTAYMEHSNGMIGHFIVTTGECPGTNRLEIVGEHGTLVYEKEALTFYRNRMSMLEYSKTTKSRMEMVENWETKIPINYNQPMNHKVVTEKFLNSILTGNVDLIAHGTEGLNPVMLANAIMLSSFEERGIRLPMDGDAFEKKLQELIATSQTKKE